MNAAPTNAMPNIMGLLQQTIPTKVNKIINYEWVYAMNYTFWDTT